MRPSVMWGGGKGYTFMVLYEYPIINFPLCQLLNKNSAFSFVYTLKKGGKKEEEGVTRSLEPCLKKKRGEGDKKEKKEKKKYVNLNGNTCDASGTLISLRKE